MRTLSRYQLDRRAAALAACLVATWSFIHAHPAVAADLYWFDYAGYSEQVGDQFSLRRLRLDQTGAQPETLLSLAGFAHNHVQPEYDALAADRGHVYWRRWSSGDLFELDAVLGAFGPVSGVPSPYSYQLFGSEIDQAGANTYIPIPSEGRILRGNFEFEQQTEFATTPQFNPNMSLALDELHGHLYWAGGCGGCALTIGRTKLDGSGTEIIGTPVYYDDFSAMLAVHPLGGKLYFSSVSDAAILRSNLDGTDIETVVSGTQPFSLAIDLHPIPEPASGAIVVVILSAAMVWCAARRRRVISLL